MVKNAGGNKSKKIGRKFITNNYTDRKLRLKQETEEDEMYACVSKIYGQGRCQIRCIDSKDRECVIRNKFRGRGKRDNTVRVGTWILAGIRGWETITSKKEQTCDLLEVYNDNEVKQLKNKVTEDWAIFSGLGDVTTELNIAGDEDGFEISTSKTEDIDETLEVEINASIQENNTKEETFGDNTSFGIDIDAI